MNKAMERTGNTDNTIRGKVSQYVIKTIKDRLEMGEEVHEDMDLRNDLGLDSLDIIEILLQCEKEYRIREEGDERRMVKVRDIVQWVSGKAAT